MSKQVLVVDDNQVNRQILHKILSADYTVLEAENGQEAMELLRGQYRVISAVLLDLIMPVLDGYQVLEQMKLNPMLSQIPVIVTTGSTEKEAEKKALALGANDYVTKPYDATIIKRRLDNLICLRETAAMVNTLQRDRLTGLWNRETFFDKAAWAIARQPSGYYVLSSVDVDNFKVVNDQYGVERGDRVLKTLAQSVERDCAENGGLCGRISADNFVVLYPKALMDAARIERLKLEVSIFEDFATPLTLSTGRYYVEDKSLSVNAMYDRASIAQATVKGRYDVHVAVYDESMRSHLLREQEIVNDMNQALATGQFEVWFQPQYNHATGALIGAEALARWRHPEKGLISPGEFVPVFERNGFVYELDKTIWEQVCRCLRTWLDQGRSPLPVSVNISRYDLFRADLVEVITGLTEKYKVPAELLRLEITESAYAESSHQVVAVVKRFIDLGFTVEIDDFGSGYSSLNTLKEVPAQIVKLDMRFLEDSENSDRGGNIIESVVRMAKWLGMAVIAEGVEDVAQADFLRSIGCFYVQGYLYARPMSFEDYDAMARGVDKEEKLIALETVENLDNNSFWDPHSMDTLIFNTYVGGACIAEYHRGRLEVIRANRKYAQTIGEGLTVDQAMRLPWDSSMDPEGAKARNLAMLAAIETHREVTDESVFHDLLGDGRDLCLRTVMRMIASAGDRYLLYFYIENVTAQRLAERQEREAIDRLRTINADLQTMMDASPNMVFIKNMELRYTRCNHKVAEMVGIDDENQLLGKTDAEILPEELARKYLGSDRRIISTGRPLLNYVETLPTTDGGIRFAETSKYPLLDSQGNVTGIFGIGRDITEERSAYSRLKMLTDSIPGGIATYEISPERVRISYFNDGFCRMLGYTREEYERISATGVTNLTLAEDVPLVLGQIDRLRREGTPINCTYRVRTRDGGDCKWVNLRGSVAERHGELIIVNTVLFDVTEHQEALRRLGR